MGVFGFQKKPLSEKQVLKKLDIPDFRHITKEKIMSFASMTGQMDPEVAKAAISQFPDFSNLVISGMSDYKEIMLETLSIDAEEYKVCFGFYDKVMAALENELYTGNTDSETRKWCILQMKDVSDTIAQHIKEGRNHRFKIIATTAGTLTVIIGAGLTALGGNFDFNWPFGHEDK